MRIFAFLLLSACGIPSIPNQGVATKIVWKDTYQAAKGPPSVYWIEQEDLNCHTDPNGKFSGWVSQGQCVAGLTFDATECEVAYPIDFVFHGSAFAHELYHAYLLDTVGGDGDPTHSGAGWQPGGILEQANAKLANEGL